MEYRSNLLGSSYDDKLNNEEKREAMLKALKDFNIDPTLTIHDYYRLAVLNKL